MKIFDSWDSYHKTPFGAIRQGEKCSFMLRIPKNVPLELPPILVIFRKGCKERFVTFMETAETDEYTEFQGEFVPRFAGVHSYYFVLVSGAKRSYIKRGDGGNGVIGEGGLFQLTVYEEKFSTPSFLKGGVMYQIFPDRFFKSGRVHSNVPADRILREDWDGVPLYRPDENGKVRNNDFFGGDLEGIIQKLPYLKELGVTCLYLNPIFEAHENHRYNTANYRKIDPLLGTEEDFKRLCEKAHSLGISVLLDGVFSHTGADSVYFNKFGRYGSGGAYNSRNSEFFPWYTFTEYPDKYDAWWGISTLPNVNELNPQYLEYICGEGGVLDYWLSLGADGWRLDVADELPDEFLDALHTAVKRNGQEKFILGEVWEDASNKVSYGVERRYLLGGQLDSVMNYPFREAILEYILGGNARTFQDTVMRILENYPKPSVDVLMNMLSTHDVERAITLLGGESAAGKGKDWQAEQVLSPEQYALGKKRLKCAMVLQFFLPGVPCIYYGDEAGLQGYRDPFNRRGFPWGKEDAELTEFVRLLASIRHRCDRLKDGELKFLFVDSDLIAFARYHKDERRAAVILLNKCGEARRIKWDFDIIRQFKTYEIFHGVLNGDMLEVPAYDFVMAKLEK